MYSSLVDFVRVGGGGAWKINQWVYTPIIKYRIEQIYQDILTYPDISWCSKFPDELDVAVFGHTSAGSQATQESSGASSRTNSFQLRLARLPRPSVLQAFSAEDRATTDKVKNVIQAGPIPEKGTARCAAMELPRPARPEGAAVYLYEECVLD